MVTMVTGCSSSMHITAQSDPAADFSQYHAFVWGSPPDTSAEKGVETGMTLKPETDKIIRQALANGLKARGVTETAKSAAGTPTLAVGYTVLVKREEVTPPSRFGDGYPHGQGPFGSVLLRRGHSACGVHRQGDGAEGVVGSCAG